MRFYKVIIKNVIKKKKNKHLKGISFKKNKKIGLVKQGYYSEFSYITEN